jgi:hypothetical protein
MRRVGVHEMRQLALTPPPGGRYRGLISLGTCLLDQ